MMLSLVNLKKKKIEINNGNGAWPAKIGKSKISHKMETIDGM